MRIGLVILLGAATACASQATTPRIRVARDLGCTADQTAVEEIAAETPRPGYAVWRVRGCGRVARYVCTTPVRDCWREGEVQADQ